MIAEPSPRQQRLESWKEIAAYINRDVRTARRWEKDRGLPVRRPPGTRPGVYALVTEIDDWLKNGHNAQAAPPSPVLSPSGRRPPLVWALVATVSVLAVALVIVIWPAPLPPRLTAHTQVTQDGWIKNTLLRRGDMLYYQTRNAPAGMSDTVRRISASGGQDSESQDLATLPPGPHYTLRDVSPDGSKVLFTHYVAGICDSELWQLFPASGKRVRIGSFCVRAAAWSPDGTTLAYVQGGALYLANADGAAASRLLNLPSERADYLRWRSDARHLRLVVGDKDYNHGRLFDVDLEHRRYSPLLPGWSHESSDEEKGGQWTADGRYFLFSASHNGSYGIWSLRESSGFGPWPNRPVLLAGFERAPDYVTPGPRGKTVHAIVWRPSRGEILRLDPRTSQFTLDPKWNWLSGGQTEFSPDGRRLVYLSYPEHVLWLADPDGSHQQRLTQGKDRGALPQWSPDGRSIAFMTWGGVTTPTRIRIVSPDGRTVLEPVSRPEWQGAPRWLSNHELVFGENGPKSPLPSTCSLHVFDLETGKVSDLANTSGLWTARPSPSGRYVAAQTTDKSKLVLYDLRTASVTDLFQARGAILGDNPTWSRDGNYIYMDVAYASDPAVYRIRIADRKVERIGSLAGIQRVVEGIGLWIGLTPDDSLLILRQVEGSEIESWSWEAP